MSAALLLLYGIILRDLHLCLSLPGASSSEGEEARTAFLAIRGFDNVPFAFRGNPGDIYNLLSLENKLTVNVLLKVADSELHRSGSHSGLFVQAIGFNEGESHIILALQGETSPRVMTRVNHLTMDVNEALRKGSFPLAGGGTANFTVRRPPAREGSVLVHITTRLVRVKVALAKRGMDIDGYWAPTHFDLDISMTGSITGTLQGIIGHTYPLDPAANTQLVTAKVSEELVRNPRRKRVHPIVSPQRYEVSNLMSYPSPENVLPLSEIQTLITSFKDTGARGIPQPQLDAKHL
eukprot:jgi/Botrbrau1/2579/Bobra.145_1s0007.1